MADTPPTTNSGDAPVTGTPGGTTSDPGSLRNRYVPAAISRAPAHTLVVFGVTVVSRTRQGAQLTSILLVPSYSG